MKPRLYLDYRRSPLYTRLGKVFLAVGVLVAVLTATLFQYYASAVSVQQEGAASQPLERSEPGNKSMLETIQQANEITQRIGAPWETLFQAIEASNASDIALLGIDAEMKQYSLRLSGEARDFNAMMRYLQRLQAIPFFSKVDLLSHHVRMEDPQHPIRFEVSASWGAQR